MKELALIGLLGILAAGAALWLASRSRGPEAFWGQDLQALHRAAQAQQLEASRQRSDRLHQVSRHGLATGEAGFFLLAPSTFEGRDHSSAVMDLEGDRLFWGVGGRLPWFHYQLADPSDVVGLGPLATAQGAVAVEIDRLFTNDLASHHAVLPSAAYPGRYSLQADLDQSAVDALTAVHGPVLGAAPFTDWFGRTISPGQQATRMVAVVVADTMAHERIDISAIVGAGVPATIRCADDLSLTETQDLLNRLQR